MGQPSMRTTRLEKVFISDAPTLRGYPRLKNLPDHSQQSQPDCRHLGPHSAENPFFTVKACIATERCVSPPGHIHRESSSEGMA